jgi:hypothetical protein
MRLSPIPRGRICKIIMGNETEPQEGYVFTPTERPGAMAEAAPGSIPGRKPPWIVVHHTLEEIVASPWPGRLWHVQILDRETHAEMVASGWTARPRRWTRAASVRILAEIPCATLFGTHGAEVCAVLDAAAHLTIEQALTLAANYDFRAAISAAARLEHAWRTETGNFDYLVPVHVPGRSLPVTYKPGPTPIGSGIRVLRSTVGNRARAIDPNAWCKDPDNPEVALLAEPWVTARQALEEAALAFGAPEFASVGDLSTMTAAWDHVFGRSSGR